MPPIVARKFLTTCCGLAHKCTWCPVVPLRRTYGGRGVSAEWEPTEREIREIAGMGIPWIYPDGGDVLLVPWFPKALYLCEELGLHTGVTLSGQMLRQRLSDWDIWWLGLPDILRFSAEGGPQVHDTKRAAGCFDAMVEGLEATTKVRKGKPTLLTLTLVPGPRGNIDKVQIQYVLDLARRYGAMIVVNFLFGTFQTRRKDECGRMWEGLTEQELEVFAWLSEQPEVLPFADKLAFIRKGGNDIANPSCRASEAVLTISPDQYVIRHCFFNTHASWKIEEDGIRGAMDKLDELYREKGAEMSGTIKEYCHGCLALCEMGIGWAHERGLTGVALAQELMRF